jgi:hypothetical protein
VVSKMAKHNAVACPQGIKYDKCVKQMGAPGFKWTTRVQNVDIRPMRSSANSDHSPCSSKAKLFHIEFSDLHVSKEVSIKPRRDQLEGQLFETEYFADEDSVLVPADIAAIVHPSQEETFRVGELRQLAWQSDRAGTVETRGDLVVQALMRAPVIEHVAKVIEAALLCAKGCRRRFRRVFLQSAMHPLMATVLLRSACLNAFMHDPQLRPVE